MFFAKNGRKPKISPSSHLSINTSSVSEVTDKPILNCGSFTPETALKAVKEGHVITMDYDKVYFFGGPTAAKEELSLYTDAIIKATK